MPIKTFLTSTRALAIRAHRRGSPVVATAIKRLRAAGLLVARHLRNGFRAGWQRTRPRQRLFIGVATVLIAIFAFSGGQMTRTPALAARLAAGAISLPHSLPAPATTDVSSAELKLQTDVVTVQSGDTLSAIFAREGFTANRLARIMALGDRAAPLTRLHPGDQLHFTRKPNGRFASLSLVLADNSRLTISHEGDGYAATRTVLPVLKRTAYAHGSIDSSVFLAARQAGLPTGVAMRMIHLFAWDIDFIHDIRGGDTFTVLYEDAWSARKGTHAGPILAAAFTVGGHTYTAIRYTDASGHTAYYTADGHNVRKAFLRAPVDYSRVSSGFSRHRMNPVLHYVRPHLGTDFAAPEGTPIHVTADGTIRFRARKGGYGNAVVVKHAGRYSTLYGHMSRFARGQHVGAEVDQGDVIGYVGHTGVATGPHVHYEFRINGRHKDPLAVKLPQAKPIDEQYRDDFETYAESILAQVQWVRDARYAAR